MALKENGKPILITANAITEEVSDSKLLFGRHRGKLFKDVPSGYLVWLAGTHSPTAGIIRNRHALFARIEMERRNAAR